MCFRTADISSAGTDDMKCTLIFEELKNQKHSVTRHAPLIYVNTCATTSMYMYVPSKRDLRTRGKQHLYRSIPSRMEVKEEIENNKLLLKALLQ